MTTKRKSNLVSPQMAEVRAKCKDMTPSQIKAQLWDAADQADRKRLGRIINEKQGIKERGWQKGLPPTPSWRRASAGNFAKGILRAADVALQRYEAAFTAEMNELPGNHTFARAQLLAEIKPLCLHIEAFLGQLASTFPPDAPKLKRGPHDNLN